MLSFRWNNEGKPLRGSSIDQEERWSVPKSWSTTHVSGVRFSAPVESAAVDARRWRVGEQRVLRLSSEIQLLLVRPLLLVQVRGSTRDAGARCSPTFPSRRMQTRLGICHTIRSRFLPWPRRVLPGGLEPQARSFRKVDTLHRWHRSSTSKMSGYLPFSTTRSARRKSAR